jgi:hypothetical protein
VSSSLMLRLSPAMGLHKQPNVSGLVHKLPAPFSPSCTLPIFTFAAAA